ncbi:MAG: acetylornithine transaminase [bacterium]
MDSNELIHQSNQYIFNTYNRYLTILTTGNGCKVFDNDGKEYIDFLSGIAVNNLGHCHPRLVKAIKDQAEKLFHVSNLYHIEPQIRLAQLLCQHSFADKIFFCNSGAEANEAAIKLARLYARKNLGEDKFEIITMKNSFHGRTLATIAATGQEKFRKGFEPVTPGFKHVSFNDINSLEKAIDKNICAVMLEPIQGEGGINIPDNDYLDRVREICDKNNILMILDEVQTGMGRTGRLFAYEYSRIVPDIMTLAKALGGGFPIGAMLAKDKIASAFIPGSHASTFGGNPLACSVAIAVLETIFEENLLNKCQQTSNYFLNRLKELQLRYPTVIKEVRGKGLLIGMELNVPGQDIVKRCMEDGFLINCTAEKVLRFAPPLIIEQIEIDRLIKSLENFFNGVFT